MATFRDIPDDVTAGIIGSFSEPIQVVQQRHLGEVWYRRYLQLLPSLVDNQELLQYAVDAKDETLIIDLLSINQGDLHDHPDLDPDLRTETLTWLGRFAAADLSQAFGFHLAKLPIFVVNLTMTLDQVYSTAQGRVDNHHGRHGQFILALEANLVSILNDMVYFDGIVKTVFLPWARRHPEYLQLIFSFNNDNELIERTITLFTQHKIDLHSEDIHDIVQNNTDLSDDNIQRLHNYPWTE